MGSMRFVPDADLGVWGERGGLAGSGDHWLSETDLLQTSHPRVRLLAVRLTQLERNARDKAMACYQFVSRVPFAWSYRPYDQSADEIVASGHGDGHTKSTLLVALLRSLGIPARVRVLAVEPSYLRGILPANARSREHVVTELLLQDGVWIAIDSYVIDPQLALRARTRLLGERRNAGYGVHLKGATAWDGVQSSFGQFSVLDPGTMPFLDFGAFDDVQQFRHYARNRLAADWLGVGRSCFATAWANHALRELRAR